MRIYGITDDEAALLEHKARQLGSLAAALREAVRCGMLWEWLQRHELLERRMAKSLRGQGLSRHQAQRHLRAHRTGKGTPEMLQRLQRAFVEADREVARAMAEDRVGKKQPGDKQARTRRA